MLLSVLASDVIRPFFGQIAHVIQRMVTNAFSFPRRTRVTYVTWDVFKAILRRRIIHNTTRNVYLKIKWGWFWFQVVMYFCNLVWLQWFQFLWFCLFMRQKKWIVAGNSLFSSLLFSSLLFSSLLFSSLLFSSLLFSSLYINNKQGCIKLIKITVKTFSFLLKKSILINAFLLNILIIKEEWFTHFFYKIMFTQNINSF